MLGYKLNHVSKRGHWSLPCCRQYHGIMAMLYESQQYQIYTRTCTGTHYTRSLEVSIQISKNYLLLLHIDGLMLESASSDQITNLLMSWQQSCHDMCKFVTRFKHCNQNQSKTNSHKIGTISPCTNCKMGPCPCLHRSWMTRHLWVAGIDQATA